MKHSEHNKIVTLARLKNGEKPKDISTMMDVPYATVLKWNKELIKAEHQDRVHELFNLDEAILDKLLATVSTDLEGIASLLGTEVDAVKEGVVELKGQLSGLSLLEAQLQDSAMTVAKQIGAQAITATSSDTLCILADALAKLNTSFFAKGTNVQINNNNGGSFEEFLGD